MLDEHLDRGHDAIAARTEWTDRAQQAACRRVGRDGVSVAAVAREYGVGWHTVMRAVERRGRPLVVDPARLAGVTHLGVDETAWLSATRDHHTLSVSGLVDTRTVQLLDVVPDRTARAVTNWLARRDPQAGRHGHRTARRARLAPARHQPPRSGS